MNGYANFEFLIEIIGYWNQFMLSTSQKEIFSVMEPLESLIRSTYLKKEIGKKNSLLGVPVRGGKTVVIAWLLRSYFGYSLTRRWHRALPLRDKSNWSNFNGWNQQVHFISQLSDRAKILRIASASKSQLKRGSLKLDSGYQRTTCYDTHRKYYEPPTLRKFFQRTKSLKLRK